VRAMRAGEELGPVRSPTSNRIDMVRMALLLHDPNPLHLDRVYAQERGFAESCLLYTSDAADE